jgi:hypothetical protein
LGGHIWIFFGFLDQAFKCLYNNKNQKVGLSRDVCDFKGTKHCFIAVEKIEYWGGNFIVMLRNKKNFSV